MPRFRKKPVVIVAEQYTGPLCVPRDEPLPCAPAGIQWTTADMTFDRYPYVETWEGRIMVSPGDWIITGVKGEKYPCKPSVFELTYEPVE